MLVLCLVDGWLLGVCIADSMQVKYGTTSAVQQHSAVMRGVTVVINR